MAHAEQQSICVDKLGGLAESCDPGMRMGASSKLVPPKAESNLRASCHHK